MDDIKKKYAKFAPSDELVRKFGGYTVQLYPEMANGPESPVTTLIFEAKARGVNPPTKPKKNAKLV